MPEKKKGDLSDFEGSIAVGDRWAVLRFSDTPDLLKFSQEFTENSPNWNAK